ncbi:MAG: hypothetical protein AAF004_12740 [Pseudomonadota bacterium]
MYDWVTAGALALYFGIAYALFVRVSRYKFRKPGPVCFIGTVSMALPPLGLFLMFALAMKAPVTGPVQTR